MKKHPGKSVGNNAGKSTVLTASALALTAAVSGIATAATEDSGDGFRILEEITITARKREENVQDTPIAVTAFTGEMLLERGALDLTDVGRIAPNVQLNSTGNVSGSSSAATVFIRGVGQSDFEISTDPGVGIYVDNVYMARTIGAVLDLVDVERIEILRGPQGTLFGRNTIGGAISITSKKPAETFGGKLTLTAGEDNHFGLQGSVDIPVSDTLGLRLSALHRQRDGYVDLLQYSDTQLGDDNVSAIRGLLRFTPSDTFIIDISADYTRENENGGAWVPRALDGSSGGPFPRVANLNTGNPACQTVAGQATNTACFGPVHLTGDEYSTNNVFYDQQTGEKIDPFSDVENYGLSTTMEMDFGAVQLKSITAYRELDSSFIRSLSHTPLVLFQNTSTRYDSEQFSQEFQLTGTVMDDQIDWLLGAYYFTEEAEQAVGLRSSLFIRAPGLRTVDNDSSALFGQATWHIGERWHLTGGVRWTSEEKETTNLLRNEAGATIQDLAGQQDTTEVTPHFSLAYDLAEDMMVYASYSQGFKSGTFSPRVVSTTVTQIPEAAPEFVDAYEIGFKADLFDYRARLNVAAFYMDYTDIQVNFAPPSDPGNLVVDNVGEADIKGIEVEFIANVSQSLSLTTNIGLLDGEFGKGEPGAQVNDLDQLPRAPDYQINLGVEYRLPMGNNGAELLTRLDWTFTDDHFLRADNNINQFTSTDSWDRGELSIAYLAADDSWTARLNVSNITDETYLTSSADGIATFGVAEGVYSRPRHVSASLSWNF